MMFYPRIVIMSKIQSKIRFLFKFMPFILHLIRRFFVRHKRPILTKDRLGMEGEERAILFLKQQGYQILDRNVHFTQGELDIIAKKDRVIVFVEVKTRRSAKYAHPRESVNKKKCKKIKKIAYQYYYHKKYAPDEYGIRFDIITLIWTDWPTGNLPKIEHFVSAFE